MKSFYFIFCLLLVGSFSIAQTFNIELDSSYYHVDIQEESSASFTYDINYLLDDVNDYQWTLSVDAPSKWSSQLCLNPIKCYGFDDTGAAVTLEPDVDYEFALKVYHNEECGTGTYILKLWNAAGTEVLEEVLSFAEVEGCGIVSTKDTDLSSQILFPNPTTGSFTIEKSNTLKDIRIYDLQGKLFRQFSPQSSYDISDLNQGIYLVQTIDNEGRAFAQKLIKK